MLEPLEEHYTKWKELLQNKIQEISSHENYNIDIVREYKELIDSTETQWGRMFSHNQLTIERIHKLLDEGKALNSPYFFQFFIPLFLYHPQITHIIVQSPIFGMFDNNSCVVRNIIKNSVVLQNQLGYLDPVTEMNIADFLLPITSYDLHEADNFILFHHILKYSKNVNHLLGRDTALSIVIRQNIPSVVVKLLEHGADITVPQVHLGLELLGSFYKSTAIVGLYDDTPISYDEIYLTGPLHAIALTDLQQEQIRKLQTDNKIYNRVREDGYSINAENAIKILKMLCCRGFDINLFDHEWVSTLLASSQIKYSNNIPNNWMTENIISCHGFNPNFLNSDGVPYSFLNYANAYIIGKILDHPSIDLHMEDVAGHKIFHAAISFCGNDVAGEVIDILLKKNIDINQRSLKGATPFFLACSLHDKLNVADYLWTKGADTSIGLHSGVLLTHISARNGDANMLTFLYNHGVPIDKPVSLLNPNTPIELASDHNDVVALLKEWLSNPHPNNEIVDVTTMLGEASLLGGELGNG